MPCIYIYVCDSGTWPCDTMQHEYSVLRTQSNCILTYIYKYNTSHCGSHFRGVREDPAVGNLTSIDIPTHTDVDSKKPTKKVL